MSEELQDVASTPEAAAPAVADSSTAEVETSQTATAGDVTTQSVIEGKEDGQVETVDSTQEADPLEGVPSLEELEQNKSQQYAQALINLRTAYEARKNEVGELKPLEALKALTDYGDAATLKSQLDAYNSLFTPVINPDTQQPEVDAGGIPRVTATKFIKQVDGENPGMAEQMLTDLLRYSPEVNGQKVPLWQKVFEAFNLDPRRLEDYRKIDALAPQSTGEITPEELETIPKELHEAYKSLPIDVREDLKEAKVTARDHYLRTQQEALDSKKFREEQSRAAAESQQQQFAQARAEVTRQQEEYVSSQLREGYASIMDTVAKQVTFSADPTENSRMLGVTGAFIFALRDPEFAKVAGDHLNALGAKLDDGFYEALSVADKHMRDQKAYEVLGQKGMAQNSQSKALAAKNQVYAKIAPLALKVAKVLGGQAAQRANQQNGLLSQATNTRPTPDGGTQAEGNGFGIAGMLPNDPRYGVELARRTGLLGR